MALALADDRIVEHEGILIFIFVFILFIGKGNIKKRGTSTPLDCLAAFNDLQSHDFDTFLFSDFSGTFDLINLSWIRALTRRPDSV
jgi:hypothetical protein